MLSDLKTITDLMQLKRCETEIFKTKLPQKNVLYYLPLSRKLIPNYLFQSCRSYLQTQSKLVGRSVSCSQARIPLICTLFPHMRSYSPHDATPTIQLIKESSLSSTAITMAFSRRPFVFIPPLTNARKSKTGSSNMHPFTV